MTPVQIRHIVCPVDLSDCSRHALDYAIAISRWYQAALTVMHVVSPELYPRRRESVLTSVEQLTSVPPEVAIDFQIVEGHVPAQTLAFAAAHATDLLVLGTHGRSGVAHLALGSVAETVLRKAPCPVLTVPSRVTGQPAGMFKRILCAIDYSHCSMRGLDYAMALAQEADARLTVLNVLESTPVIPPNGRATVLANASTLHEYVKRAEDTGRVRLDACIPDEVRQYCSVETRLATGDAAQQILHTAAEAASDLIVIGLHGRSAADVWFFGSTAQAVVRAATCPVLTLSQA